MDSEGLRCVAPRSERATPLGGGADDAGDTLLVRPPAHDTSSHTAHTLTLPRQTLHCSPLIALMFTCLSVCPVLCALWCGAACVRVCAWQAGVAGDGSVAWRLQRPPHSRRDTLHVSLRNADDTCTQASTLIFERQVCDATMAQRRAWWWRIVVAVVAVAVVVCAAVACALSPPRLMLCALLCTIQCDSKTRFS